MSRITQHVKIFRLALVGAVLAGLVLASLLAVSTELHELLHHDGDTAEHQCLATLMQMGGCDNSAPEPLAVAAFLQPLFTTVPVGESAWVKSVFSISCVFEHAPPFRLLS